jgi:hypothetical protein
MGDEPVTSPLPTYRTAQIQNKRMQTSMPRVGFEPTTLVFELMKTVQASDRAVTMKGPSSISLPKIQRYVV